MSSILTNTSAMVALQTMKGINANLNKTQADISTGKSVATAKDNAAYWRAKEGEIARTLLAMPEVKAARVHIASAPTRAFQPEAKPTASVTLTTASGTLTEAQARAIRHLVASAVAGMTPDAVQIIDTVAGLIGGEDAQAFDTGDAAGPRDGDQGQCRASACRPGRGRESGGRGFHRPGLGARGDHRAEA
jgi:flagellar M-ring protein FliF